LATQLEEALADPVTFIVIGIAIGLVHVNIAHLMALIKGIKGKEKGVVPNKIGLFMLQIFGIPYICHSLLNIELLPLSAATYSVFLYVLLGSIVLIVASSFMIRGGLGGIFWLFDITGLLGDVMSYCRIAGVSLATLYLAQCFNMIADMVSGMMPGAIGGIIGVILAIIVLLFTHALNLFLAGLASFIHSLRLCFVEFLMKFYEGDGRAYTPFRLRRRTAVTTGGR
jgi:V/A-type H+-transporting ATPase subunit I